MKSSFILYISFFKLYIYLLYIYIKDMGKLSNLFFKFPLVSDSNHISNSIIDSYQIGEAKLKYTDSYQIKRWKCILALPQSTPYRALVSCTIVRWDMMTSSIMSCTCRAHNNHSYSKEEIGIEINRTNRIFKSDKSSKCVHQLIKTQT